MKTALIPTMGNLHDGHLQLVKKAQKVADRVIVSIYVNPTQFNDSDDFTNYPRTLEQDKEKLTSLGVDEIFTPNDLDIYPTQQDREREVVVPEVANSLCGASRPGHFAGVIRVVQRLFELTQPDVAMFGEKDWQQLQVIKQMVKTDNLPVKIISVPTVREHDGLAMSSRNNRLSINGRAKAEKIYAALQIVAEQIKQSLLMLSLIQGNKKSIPKGMADNLSYTKLEDMGASILKENNLEVEYFLICNPTTLKPATIQDKKVIILIAAIVDGVRLIDNLVVG